MRNIAVYTNFMTDEHRGQISGLAQSLGFSVEFFARGDQEEEARFSREISGYEVIFGNPPSACLGEAKQLRWLCSAAAGVEPYLGGAWPEGCQLTGGSGAYGLTIAEHILMVLLMLFRRMPEYQSAASRQEWPYFTPIRSIAGSRMVLLGTGDIGRNTARRLKALGAAEVIGASRSGHSDENAFDRVIPVSDLDSVLPRADALILSLPATAETMGILSRERLALLPPSACVVNVGRGSAIDQEALVEALQTGRLAGAALDVMTPEPLPEAHPLWHCPNTIITPHVSGNMSLGITCELAVEKFCRNLERYAGGQPLENLIDRTKGY